MNRHHLNRLLKLANHLRYGKLMHKEFYFGNYNGTIDDEYDKKGCGTTGCAIGECPAVFRQWVNALDSDGTFMPMLQVMPKSRNGSVQTEKSGMEFFGMEDLEYGSVFIPGASDRKLESNATKNKVSAHIRKFVKFKCKELKIPYTSLVNKRK